MLTFVMNRTFPFQVQFNGLTEIDLCTGTKLEVKTKTPNGVQFTVKGNQDPKAGMLHPSYV